MSTVTALSGSNFPIGIGNTLNIGVRPSVFSAGTTVASGTAALTAQQGASTVSTALTNATSIFSALSSVLGQIQQAGASPDKATAAALTASIAKLDTQINQLAAGAKVGNTNLLASTQGSVSVATTSGVQVNIAAQGLDSTSLGLGKLAITDAASLRSAVSKISLALGQTQLAIYRLQTANSVVGTTSPTSAASTDYGTAISNQLAGSSANTVSALVERALNNQTTANASGYGRSGAATWNTGAVQSFFSLLT